LAPVVTGCDIDDVSNHVSSKLVNHSFPACPSAGVVSYSGFVFRDFDT